MRFLLFALLAAPLLAADHDHAPSPVPESPDLKFGSISIYSENDKYLANTDQHYTNGFKLSVLSAPLSNFTADPAPASVQWLARHLSALIPPGNDCKLGLSFGQNLYTPTNIRTPTPSPLDRPYAAWLYLGAAFQSYTLNCCTDPAMGLPTYDLLDAFEINLGMVGPAALGREIQNGFHSIIGALHALGWSRQINNEPGLVLSYERKWRWQTAEARTGWGLDFIPHAGVTVGNIFTHANVGFEARAGWRIPSDFGTNLIRASGDSNSARAAWSVFIFAAVDGRAVARDVTLDGNTFRRSPSVDKESFVADFQAGLGLGSKHWQLTYCQAVRTKEFSGQVKNSNFGSISVTFFY